VRLYDVGNNIQRHCFNENGAVLDCCFSGATHGFSGGLEKAVKW